jgi:hypothetical protein
MGEVDLSYNLLNSNIFFSIIYFLFTIIGIYGLGNIIIYKRLKKSYYSYIIGLFFFICLSPFASLNIESINYFILIFLIFGFFQFSYQFYNFNFFKNNFKEINIFLLIFVIIFFDAFYNFNPLDDDLRGYFAIVKQYSDGNLVHNAFDFRKISFFPSYYFLVSIFFENGNFYNFKFVDKFFGYLLIYLIISDKIQINKKHFFTKTIYTLVYLILILNEPLTSTPNILLTAIILFGLCELDNFYNSKKEIHLFLFYLSLFFLIILKITVLPFVVMLGFLVFIILFFKYKFFSKKLYLSLSISFLIIFVPWFYWSYINFDTLWFPLLGKGNFFLSHDNLKNIIEFENNIFNKINFLIYNYDFNFIIEFYDRQVFNIIFLIIILNFAHKKINNIVTASFLFAIFVYFLNSLSFLMHVDRQIVPIFNGILLFFLLQYKFSQNLKIFSKINFLLIILLVFNIKLIGGFFYNFMNKSIMFTTFNYSQPYNTFYPKQDINELFLIENKIDKEKILTIISKPYLLDFQKNNYLTLCYYNFVVSPKPGYPIFSEFKDKSIYFLKNDVEYFLLEKNFFLNHSFEDYDDYISKNKKDSLLENFYEYNYKMHISAYVDFSKYVKYLMVNNIIFETDKYVLLKL